VSAPELIARGDPIVHEGVPTALEVLAWLVGGFWVLFAAIVFAVLYARKRRAAQSEADRVYDEAHAEHEHREHVAFMQRLRPVGERTAPAIMRGERGRVVLYPELSGVVRSSGRHRDGHGRRRVS
jgi:hypothetical protein